MAESAPVKQETALFVFSRPYMQVSVPNGYGYDVWHNGSKCFMEISDPVVIATLRACDRQTRVAGPRTNGANEVKEVEKRPSDDAIEAAESIGDDGNLSPRNFAHLFNKMKAKP